MRIPVSEPLANYFVRQPSTSMTATFPNDGLANRAPWHHSTLLNLTWHAIIFQSPDETPSQFLRLNGSRARGSPQALAKYDAKAYEEGNGYGTYKRRQQSTEK